jgi:hypothetical protein
MRVRISRRMPVWGGPGSPKRRSPFWDWTFEELLAALLIEAPTGRMPAREEVSAPCLRLI